MTQTYSGPHLTSISAVFPAYNDGGTIATMILTASMAMRQITDDYEVIVTDDGSQDYTYQILEEMAKYYPFLHVFRHDNNQGYGSTLQTGFSAATKDWIFYTDGDAQYNPLELPRLAEALSEDIDIVNGYKISRHDSLQRKIIGKLYHHLVRIFFGFKLRDINCDFRLIRRSALSKLNIESKNGSFGLELVKKLQDSGAKFSEVPVHHYPRSYGSSQFFSLKHLYSTGLQLITLWWKLVILKEHLRGNRHVD
jgi:glycosyltransferase involved in cell wall biosynthesis